MAIYITLLDKEGQAIPGYPSWRPCVGFTSENEKINANGPAHTMQLHLAKMQDNYERSFGYSNDLKKQYHGYVPKFLQWLQEGMFKDLFKDVLQKNGNLVFDLNKHSYLTVQTITSIWRNHLRYYNMLGNMMFINEHGIHGKKFNLDQAFLISEWLPYSAPVNKSSVGLPKGSDYPYSTVEDFLSIRELQIDLEDLSKKIPEIFNNEIFWNQPNLRSLQDYNDWRNEVDDEYGDYTQEDWNKRVGIGGSSSYLNTLLANPNRKVGKYTFGEILEV
jgi:hypothetical protein